MTMTAGLLDWIGSRGLDPEVGDRLGFDGGQRDSGEVLVIAFIRDGNVVRRKYRPLTPKPDQPRFTQDKGGVRCAWNEDCLRDPDLVGHALVITEGEMDGWAAVQCGFAKTISVPDGAPPPIDPAKAREHAESLQEGDKYSWLRELIGTGLLDRDRVPEIILATDGDDNGAQLLADLTKLLGPFRCKFVTYPKAKAARKRLKDLNEVLQQYGAKGVRETIDRAQFVTVTGIFKLGEMKPKAPALIYDIGFELMSRHYKLRMGDFCVVTGVPSSGKTTWVQDMLCRVIERHGIKVCWGSFEQDPQVDHKRNFRRWYNRMPVHQQTVEQKEAADEWIDRYNVFIVPDEDEDTTLEWLLEKMEVAVLRHGVSVIVLDPWNELDHLRDRGETSTEYTGRAIKTLKKFAKRMGVHLIVVAHPTKMQRDKDGKYPIPTLYDVEGSAHWFNKADMSVIVHRETQDNTRVKVPKSRFHDIIGTPGSVIMQFSRDDGRFIETERGAE